MSDNIINTTNITNTTTTTKRKAGRPKLTEEEKLARKQAKENGEKPEYKDTRTDVSETAVTHVNGEDFCRFYSTEVWGRNFIKKMFEEHPEECKPLLWDEGVCVEITLPAQSIKYIKWPVSRSFTDEQKEALKERAKKAREGRKNNKED